MNTENEWKDKYEALERGCLSETAAKESYLHERNELLAQRDVLVETLELAAQIIGHPDDAASQYIASVIADAKGT
jgi:hypothetical protein